MRNCYFCWEGVGIDKSTSFEYLIQFMEVSNLKNSPIFSHLPLRNEVRLQSWEDDVLHYPSPWLLLIERGVYGTRFSGGAGGSCWCWWWWRCAFAFSAGRGAVSHGGGLFLFSAVQEEGVMLSAVEVTTLLSKCLETLFLCLPLHLNGNTCVHTCLHVEVELTSVASLTRKSGSLSRLGEWDWSSIGRVRILPSCMK